MKIVKDRKMPPVFLQQPEGTVTIRILAGKEWRGVTHVQPREYHLSPSYAEHVVSLGLAEYVNDDAGGNKALWIQPLNIEQNKNEPADKNGGKKEAYDRTSSKRADQYLTRLQGSKGRRLPVDLDADRSEKLSELQDAGYAKTAADVIRKAIDDAYSRVVESPRE